MNGKLTALIEATKRNIAKLPKNASRAYVPFDTLGFQMVERLTKEQLAGNNLVIADIGLATALAFRLGITGLNNQKTTFLTNSKSDADFVENMFGMNIQYFSNMLEYNPFMKFDVIVGNPPYNGIKVSQVPKQLQTEGTKHVSYLPFIKLGLNLLKDAGEFCFIVPSTFLKTKGYETFINEHMLGKPWSLSYQQNPFTESGIFVKETAIIHQSPWNATWNGHIDECIDLMDRAIKKHGYIDTFCGFKYNESLPSKTYMKWFNKREQKARGRSAAAGALELAEDHVDFRDDDKHLEGKGYTHLLAYNEWMPSKSIVAGKVKEVLLAGKLFPFMPVADVMFCVPCREQDIKKLKWFLEESTIMRRYINTIRSTDNIRRTYAQSLPNVLHLLSDEPSDQELECILGS